VNEPNQEAFQQLMRKNRLLLAAAKIQAASFGASLEQTAVRQSVSVALALEAEVESRTGL
jgi:hypothetical protein